MLMVELPGVQLLSKTEPFTPASGSTDSVMDLVARCGQTAAGMKATGSLTKQMDKESLFTLTETYMRVSG